MSKKISKIIAIVVALMLFSTMFAACGKKPSETTSKTTSEATSETTVTTAKAPLPEVTLKLYFPDRKYADFDTVWSTFSEKTKDTLNVKFETNFVGWNDYGSKLQLLTASGDNFDGFFDANWNTYTQMVTKGALLDITETLPKYAPEYYKQLETIKAVDAIKVSGKIYAMPATEVGTERRWFIYRSDLATKYGVDLSAAKTIEDAEPYFEAIKKNESGMMPIWWDKGTGANNIVGVYQVFQQKHNLAMVGDGFVYSLDDPACKVIPFEQTDAFKEATLLIKSWYDKGYIGKNMYTLQAQQDQFNAGKAASFIHVISSGKGVIKVQGQPDATNSGYTLNPDNKAPLSSPLGNLFCINKNAANPERLIMFIEQLSTKKDLYDLIMYGIEGKHYVLDGDKAAYPAGVDPTTSTYMDWPGQWGFLRHAFIRPTDLNPQSYLEANAAEVKDPHNVLAALVAFTPMPDAIKTELAKRDTVADQELRVMEFGIEKDADKAVTDYIAHQKTAGVDVCVTEMQKQVDAFLATQK